MSPSAPSKPGRATTLTALADRLGLSTTTVSFVLNGQGERRKIAPKTVERVLAAAKEADYVPNALARGLRQKRTQAIGVVLPHLRGDWAHRIMQGVAAVLGDSGVVPLIVCHYGSSDLERQLLNSLVERRVDGIICNPLADGFERYRQVQQRGMPLVFLSDAPKGLDEIGFVAWDLAVIELAIQHLVDLGHRRIAYLGVRDNRQMSRRSRQAFRESLDQSQIDCPKEFFVLREPGEGFEEPVLELMAGPNRPTAFFAAFDDIAISALKAVRSAGYDVPGDVSIATIGDAPGVTEPGYGITTVRAPVVEEGRACAESLVQTIDHPDRDPIRRLVTGGELIIGTTTGPPPGSDI